MRRRRWKVLATATCLGLALAGCSGSEKGVAVPERGECPGTPVKIVATINVWASVVEQLGGSCARVVTAISNLNADPHEYEPTAETSAEFALADVAVVNGLGYDAWAQRVLDSLGSDAPRVVNLGDAIGLRAGDNPHIWYSPAYVEGSAIAISAALGEANPGLSAEFERGARGFREAIGAYLGEIAALKSRFGGTRIGATESLFAYMAQATNLVVTTPQGLLDAAARGTDPSSQDIQTAREQLSDGTDRVLVCNLQVDGPLPRQLLDLARERGVPVVGITETLAPAGITFQDWQLAQLRQLSDALGA